MNIVGVVVTIDDRPRPFGDTVADLAMHGLVNIVELPNLNIATGDVDEPSIPDLAALTGVLAVEIDQLADASVDY